MVRSSMAEREPLSFRVSAASLANVTLCAEPFGLIRARWKPLVDQTCDGVRAVYCIIWYFSRIRRDLA